MQMPHKSFKQFLHHLTESAFCVGVVVIPTSGAFRGQQGVIEKVGKNDREGTVIVSFGPQTRSWFPIPALQLSKG
jgi:transcription antitermination factor NusG